jgi:diguanylate cyclase (GGDEF)-like protein
VDRSVDELAKAWLVGVIERTPLDRVTEVNLDLLTDEAIPLIAAILSDLDPEAPVSRRRPHDPERIAPALGRLRRGAGAVAEVPRDLAVLQSVLLASLGRDGPGRHAADFARSAQRLAEIFGSVQGALTEGMVRTRSLAAEGGEPTATSEREDLDEWLRVMLAEYRRYGRPFAVALVRVEGLEPLTQSYGRGSSEVMLTAVARVIQGQIRIADRAFRLGEDEFWVLAPSVDANRLSSMADRLVRVVEASQSADRPRIAVCAGVSACPEHGHDGVDLLEAAERAARGASGAGSSVEVAAATASPPREEANGTYQNLQ